jgi:hypothetical protein
MRTLHPRRFTRITEEQARAAVSRFANRHFNNPGEKSRATIPADENDDDILLMDYISQRENDAEGRSVATPPRQCVCGAYEESGTVHRHQCVACGRWFTEAATPPTEKA